MKLKEIELRTEDYGNIWMLTITFEITVPVDGIQTEKKLIKKCMGIHQGRAPEIVAQGLEELAKEFRLYGDIFKAGQIKGNNA